MVRALKLVAMPCMRQDLRERKKRQLLLVQQEERTRQTMSRSCTSGAAGLLANASSQCDKNHGTVRTLHVHRETSQNQLWGGVVETLTRDSHQQGAQRDKRTVGFDQTWFNVAAKAFPCSERLVHYWACLCPRLCSCHHVSTRTFQKYFFFWFLHWPLHVS